MTTAMTTAQLAELVTGHLTEHRPTGTGVPCSLTVKSLDQQEARVQLATFGLTDTAAGLLAWADDLEPR